MKWLCIQIPDDDRGLLLKLAREKQVKDLLYLGRCEGLEVLRRYAFIHFIGNDWISLEKHKPAKVLTVEDSKGFRIPSYISHVEVLSFISNLRPDSMVEFEVGSVVDIVSGVFGGFYGKIEDLLVGNSYKVALMGVQFNLSINICSEDMRRRIVDSV